MSALLQNTLTVPGTPAEKMHKQQNIITGNRNKLYPVPVTALPFLNLPCPVTFTL